jgi:hypothetical protein
MLTRAELRAELEHMEAGLAATRRNLFLAERRLAARAEEETIRHRPKARYYHRRMSRWTGADEAQYRRVLDAMLTVTRPELERLRRRAERQDAAIEALRRKYRVKDERPFLPVW